MESRFLVIAGDRMSRGLRQKEKLRLGEAARGSRWVGGSDGGLHRHDPWWEEGFATYLACGGPLCPLERWVSRGRGHTKESGARPWGSRTLFVNWTRAGQGDL